MKAQNLTLERIFERDFHIDLDGENHFACEELQQVRNGIKLVLKGDHAQTQGTAKFSFSCDQDQYVVIRNFDDKTICVLKNNQPIEVDIDNLSHALFGIDYDIFEKLFMITCADFDSILHAPKEHFDSLMRLYGIDDDAIEEKIQQLTTEINNHKANLAYLTQQKTVLADADGDTHNYKKDIAHLQTQIAEIDKMLFWAGQAQEDKVTREKLNKEWDSVEEKRDRLQSYKVKLEKNKQIEDALFIIEKNRSVKKECDEIDAMLTGLNTQLDHLQSEHKSLQAVLDQTAQDCQSADQRFTASVNDFMQGATPDDDSEIYQKMASYYTDYDKKALELSQTLNSLAEQHQALSAEIVTAKQALQEAKYPASVKKAVRDGLVLEANLANKIASLEQINAGIVQTNASIATLKTQIARNKEELEVAAAQSAEVLGEDITYQMLYDQLNQDEKQKQTLYRNQIIIANTEREITAVDNKIYENQEAQRSYIEDKTALENAKETLHGYIKKLNDKIKGIDEKLVLVSAQKKYHDAIYKSTYGDKCPVCNNMILEKSDFSKESKLIENAYSDLLIEKQKAGLVKKDYDQQMAQVNLRLGELANRISTSTTYLESLKDTKKAKYQLIEKLLTQSKAKSFSTLTVLLDAATKKVAITTNEFVKASKFRLLETTLQRGIDDATSQINHLQDVVLANALSAQERTEKVIAKYNKELDLLATHLEQTTAERKAMALTEGESKEDDLAVSLDELNQKEYSLMEEITAVERELIAIASRDDSIRVEKDGESLTYPQLFVSLLKEECSCRFVSLKAVEEEKQALQDKHLQTLRLVASKEQEICALRLQIAQANAKKDAQQEMIDTLNKDANFDAEAFDAQDTDALGKDRLGQETLQNMQEYIKEHQQGVDIIKTKITLLDQRLTQNKVYLDDYDKNLAAKASLVATLNDCKNLRSKAAETTANYEYVLKEIASVQAKLDATSQQAQQVTAMKEKDATALIGKSTLSPKTTLNMCEKALAIIDMETTITALFQDYHQLLHRFMVLDPTQCQDSDIDNLRTAAAPYNISFLTSD